METNFVPGEPSVVQLVRAVKLLVADFDGRPTGTGGRPFEFYPSLVHNNAQLSIICRVGSFFILF